VLAFSSFKLSPMLESDIVQIQEQSSEFIASDNVKIEREKRKTQTNYTSFFHNPKVVMSPVHFQEEFTKINIWLSLRKHTRKRLPDTQAYKQEISYAQAQKQETSK